MQALKSLVFTFCLASLCAGVILHLFPDAAAKRCMKAVAGLYILSALLSSVQGADAFLTDATVQLAQASEQAQEGIQQSTGDDFTDTILAQTASSLNSQYAAELAAMGYTVGVEVALLQTDQSVVLQGVCVTASTTLTEQEKAAIRGYFSTVFANVTVSFLEEAGGSP